MSEHEGGDGKVGAFLLGFLVGVLVCLGAGTVMFTIQTQRSERARMEAMRAADEAAAARDMAEQAQRQVQLERERAAKALEEAKKAREGK